MTTSRPPSRPGSRSPPTPSPSSTRSRPSGGARVQLKVDTGLSRGGAARADWEDLFAAAAAHEADGRVRVTGIWSHFAASDEPAHPANDAQEAAFREALLLAERAGLEPEVTHLANSAATILRPSSHFDLVRCGIASYGLDPAPGVEPAAGAAAGDDAARPAGDEQGRPGG